MAKRSKASGSSNSFSITDKLKLFKTLSKKHMWYMYHMCFFRQNDLLVRKAAVKENKSRMISLRITEKQYNYLEKMAIRIRKQTGFKITRASIILKLMELGQPYLEKEFSSDGDD